MHLDLIDFTVDLPVDPRQAIGIPLALIGGVFLSLGAQFQHRGVNKVEANTVEVTGGLDPRQLLQTDFVALRPGTTLGELVEIFRHASRNLFPVVAAGGRLLGIVSLDSVRDALFDDAHYNTTKVRELMQPAPAIVGPADDLEHTLALLDRLGAWALPVCEEDGRYLGFILKSAILARYRRQLIQESEA